MPVNIKNPDVEKLINEVADLTGETKTEAVRKALEERKAKLMYRNPQQDRGTRLRRFLEQEVWPQIPRNQVGRKLSRDEEDAILGYGSEGI